MEPDLSEDLSELKSDDELTGNRREKRKSDDYNPYEPRVTEATIIHSLMRDSCDCACAGSLLREGRGS